jgi:hypothetical protein
MNATVVVLIIVGFRSGRARTIGEDHKHERGWCSGWAG